MDLHELINNIPKLDDRIEVWKKVVEQINFVERENLEICIDAKQCLNTISETDLTDLYESMKGLSEPIIKKLDALIAKLRQPYEFILDEYVKKLFDAKKKEILQCIDKDYEHALSLQLKEKEREKYLKDKLSMITPFLYQPPDLPTYIHSAHQWERVIVHNAFIRNWNPSSLSTYYQSQLKKQFKDYAADCGC